MLQSWSLLPDSSQPHQEKGQCIPGVVINKYPKETTGYKMAQAKK